MSLSSTYYKNIKGAINEFVFAPKSILPLVTFRILFGAMMCVGTARFVYNGWIDKLFIEPNHFFKFYGFEWVTDLSTNAIYNLHYVILIAALFVCLGFLYRLSIITFLLTFSYVELIDATNYLNHYYLVIILAGMLCFLPANARFSLDVLLFPKIRKTQVPAWNIHIIIAQLCVVYFFAGLAKVNTDWLLRAMPLSIWLPERQAFPIIGTLFTERWVAYAFSWFGCVYDLTIWIFLLMRKTRPIAYLFVIIFHLLTWSLFNIGLFPIIMITSTLIFFSANWHGKIYAFLGKKVQFHSPLSFASKSWIPPSVLLFVLGVYFSFQLVFPLRSHLYSGNVLWHEQGYRFSWRVMLVEKSGTATFYLENPDTGKKVEIRNSKYLTPFQEKQMIIQPDFILQYAQMIAQDYREKYDIQNPKITADIFVALNKRVSQRFIRDDVNLLELEDNFLKKKWILPHSDKE